MEPPQPQPQPQDGNDERPVDNNNSNENDPDARRRPPYTISVTKLVLIGVLTGFGLFLQVTVWTLEALVQERRQAKLQHHSKLLEQDQQHKLNRHKHKKKNSKAQPYKAVEVTTRIEDLHQQQNQHSAPTGRSSHTQRNAQWRQAVELWLSSWDPNVPVPSTSMEQSSSSSTTHPTMPESSSSGNTPLDSSSSAAASPFAVRPLVEDWHQNATLAWWALQQAAQQGHAQAQFHVANALASGLYVGDEVQETWSDPDSPQQQQAWLLWHMAALGGHVEAATALAFRMAELQQQPPQTDSSSSTTTTTLTTAACHQQLPYFQEAALGIVDALETDPQSRAKVSPATDKHVLYQIHLHGGTPSKLEFHNKADESVDALQYYHLRAFGSGRDKETAASSAFTLANYYHHGVRGVTQNLTLAAQYYQRAASLNHWESAGVLGHLYAWGTGVPQDLYQAHKYFAIGMPLSFAACQRRYQLKLKQATHNLQGSGDEDEDDEHDSNEVIHLCDAECINGMGLLKLFGLPHVMKVDVAQALQFFALARDQGSADAAYNHAMLKLGWTIHWKPSSSSSSSTGAQGTTANHQGGPEKDQQQQTLIKDQMFPQQQSRHHPTLNEYQTALSDFTYAAGKGHIQARLRLGLLFVHGIQIPSDATTLKNQNKDALTGQSGGSSQTTITTTTVVAIPKDCTKALKHFRWIVESVCPFRTRRLRKAYKQYIAGDTQASLLNYLTAAETGSSVGLLNAAFLLEQGECLSTAAASSSSSFSSSSPFSSSASPFASSSTVAPSGNGASASSSSSTVLLNSVECAKASARLWKAAANKGHGEASLRVGDFYYYRRFREPGSGAAATMGPFGWIQYLIFPEHGIPIVWNQLVDSVVWLYDELVGRNLPNDKQVSANQQQDEGDKDKVCEVDENNPEQCRAVDDDGATSSSSTTTTTKPVVDPGLESDLEMAAHYYRMATDTADNARAHFNLGFLYEWGLGLKQDFPLAKRHYDLAVSGSNTNEAELPVAIALWTMQLHEKCLKWYSTFVSWWFRHGSSSSNAESTAVGRMWKDKRIRTVLVSHLLSFESLAIALLTLVLAYLLRIRDQGQRRV